MTGHDKVDHFPTRMITKVPSKALPTTTDLSSFTPIGYKYFPFRGLPRELQTRIFNHFDPARKRQDREALARCLRVFKDLTPLIAAKLYETVALSWLFSNHWTENYFDFPPETRHGLIGWKAGRRQAVLPAYHLHNTQVLIISSTEYPLTRPWAGEEPESLPFKKIKLVHMILETDEGNRDDFSSSACSMHYYDHTPRTRICLLCEWISNLPADIYLIDLDTLEGLRRTHRWFDCGPPSFILRTSDINIEDHPALFMDSEVYSNVKEVVVILNSLPCSTSDTQSPDSSLDRAQIVVYLTNALNCLGGAWYDEEFQEVPRCTFVGMEQLPGACRKEGKTLPQEETQTKLEEEVKASVQDPKDYSRFLKTTTFMSLKDYSKTLKGVKKRVISDVWWEKWDKDDEEARQMAYLEEI